MVRKAWVEGSVGSLRANHSARPAFLRSATPATGSHRALPATRRAIAVFRFVSESGRLKSPLHYKLMIQKMLTEASGNE